ncbi:MAG: hypothetical protein R2771_11365 [Saprospiraceae bacterium]
MSTALILEEAHVTVERNGEQVVIDLPGDTPKILAKNNSGLFVQPKNALYYNLKISGRQCWARIGSRRKDNSHRWQTSRMEWRDKKLYKKQS